MRDGWERVRSAASEFGLGLPAYDKTGDVLIFENDGGTWRVAASFGRLARGRKQLAVGLVEALRRLAARHQFALLDR